jgi:hypothetical protein
MYGKKHTNVYKETIKQSGSKRKDNVTFGNKILDLKFVSNEIMHEIRNSSIQLLIENPLITWFLYWSNRDDKNFTEYRGIYLSH